MPDDRLLRASIRESEKVNSWPIALRYFWTQLWGYCDSYGRGRRDARLVLAGTFPMDEEVTTENVDRWMQALEMAGVIRSYEIGGKRYFECVNWDEHQPLKYRKRTTIPDRFGVVPTSGKSSETFQKSSHDIEGDIDREIEGGSTQTCPPVDNSEPSQFCQKHPHGTTKNCRPCADARRANQAWLRKRADKPTALPPRTDATPAHEHRWMPDGTCLHCTERKATA